MSGPQKNLRLVEYFWTFQGEGANMGRRAFFVRMPFCNLKCSWCDTDFNKSEEVSEEQLALAALSEQSRFAVITGGEPTMNKQTPRVIQLLKDFGFEIAVETNGMFPIPAGIDFVTVSPKRAGGYKIHSDAAFKCNELKLVVEDVESLRFAESIQREDWTKLVRLSLSPEFNMMPVMVRMIELFIKENPRWRLSLQTHKWIGVR